MFIQTEATPNPSTLKFLPGRTLLTEGTRDYRSAAEAMESPLAQALFAIPGVSGVFYGYDFVTITKSDTEWQHLKPAVLGAIMEHFVSGAPLFVGAATQAVEDEFFDSGDEQTVAAIKELLETRVRPAVAGDGDTAQRHPELAEALPAGCARGSRRLICAKWASRHPPGRAISLAGCRHSVADTPARFADRTKPSRTMKERPSLPEGRSRPDPCACLPLIRRWMPVPSPPRPRMAPMRAFPNCSARGMRSD